MQRLLVGRFGLASGACLIVAYSGGLDSHVLLHLLAQLRGSSGWRLRAVHVDHRLQPASAAWAEHCRRVCMALDVACTIERVEVALARAEGLESAARRARYAALARHVGPGEILLTAHHRDDQAETLLLQLLRGAGVHGLRAMPAAAPFGAGRHLRPLLGYRRRALEDYAQRQGLQWIEDASNFDIGLSRNFIRHRVLPLLERRWPNAVPALARAADHAAEAAALLDQLAAEDLSGCASGEQGLALSLLNALAEPRRRNLLRYWLRARGLKPPTAVVLEQILAQCARVTRSGLAIVRWPGGELRRYRDVLTARAPEPEPDPWLELTWTPPAPLAIPGVGRLIVETTTGGGISPARVAGRRLRVRLRRGGETCRLRGHRHKLKKLLQEARVPPWERARLPLVYADEELVAIGDRWVCDGFVAEAGEMGWRLVLEKLH